MSKCYYCKRPFLEDVKHPYSWFSITPNDIEALVEIKKQSFGVDKRPSMGFLDQGVSNASGETLEERLRNATTITGERTTIWHVLVGMVWAVKPDSLFENWNKHAILWRTMTDRDVNINDIRWVALSAFNNNIAISAIFLQKNSFVWVVMGKAESEDSVDKQNALKRAARGVDYRLSKLTLRQNSEGLAEINKALFQLGKVEVHQYPTTTMRKRLAATNPLHIIGILATPLVLSFISLAFAHAYRAKMSAWFERRLFSEAEESYKRDGGPKTAHAAEIRPEQVRKANTDFDQMFREQALLQEALQRQQVRGLLEIDDKYLDEQVLGDAEVPRDNDDFVASLQPHEQRLFDTISERQQLAMDSGGKPSVGPSVTKAPVDSLQVPNVPELFVPGNPPAVPTGNPLLAYKSNQGK